MGRSKGNRKGAGRKTVALLVDGETELWYLQMLKRNELLKNVSILPELPRKKKLFDQFQVVKANAEIYDLSIWVVDMDVVIAEGKTAELKSYLEEGDGIDNIHILINSPCLEFWFLMHVRDTGRYFAECDPVGRLLKGSNPLKSYEKTEKYFVRTNPDIYKRLRPHLAMGVANATKRGNYDREAPEQAKAELYKLFTLLEIPL